MRTLIVLLAVMVTASAQAADILDSCFATKAQFFAHDLEEIAQEAEQPVLLLNKESVVVGVMRVKVERDSKDAAKVNAVSVSRVSLCSKALQTSDFHYLDNDDDNLLKWAADPKRTISMTQDEGSLMMNVAVERRETYATKLKVSFKAYDVFYETDPPEDDDLGRFAGEGEFYFYVPANWKMK